MEKNKNLITIIVVLVVLIVLAGLVWWYIQQRGKITPSETLPNTENLNEYSQPTPPIPPTPSNLEQPVNNEQQSLETSSDQQATPTPDSE